MAWIAYLLCFCAGSISAIFLLGLIITWYIMAAPKGSPGVSDPPPVYHIPKSLESMGMYTDSGDCAAAMSLTFQFLFQELKNTQTPLAWLQQKLHKEMLEIVTRSTSGKLFDSFVVRSISTGDSAPCIRWAGVQNVETIDEGRLKTLDLLLDIHYAGGFKLDFDASLLLGKVASFNVEVEQLSGRARLRFTRDPYTHWSLSFLNPPHLKLCVNPFKGRLAALLQAHALRSLQKKHTLPNFTIRYKPFFTKTDPAQLNLPNEDPSIKIQGDLAIGIIDVTRLMIPSNLNDDKIYCTLFLDSNPWISYRQDENYSIFTVDIIIHKEQNQQLGAVFKQVENKNKFSVVIETVYPISAAYKADLRRNDVIIAIDGNIINSTNHLAKVIKNIKRPYFTIRIERKSRKFVSEYSQYATKADNEKTEMSKIKITEGVARKREKSRSFSFKRVSAVLETAKNMGLDGSPLLPGFHSNESIMGKNCKSTLNLSSLQDEISQAHAIESEDNVLQNSDTAPVGLGYGIRKRRCSVENKTSSDSSNSSTPTISSPGTPSKYINKSNKKNELNSNKDSNTNTLRDVKHCYDEANSSDMTRGDEVLLSNNECSADNNCYSSTNPNITLSSSDDCDQAYFKTDTEMFQLYHTNLLPLSEIIKFNDKNIFQLNQNHRYLNLNIWSKSCDSSDDTLLAYLNVPILSLLKECDDSDITQHKRKFTLLSPEVILSVSKTHPLSTHPGFEPCLCYGDILLSFAWSKSTTTANSKHAKENDAPFQEPTHDNDQWERGYSYTEPTKVTPEKQIYDSTSPRSHTFFRTQFHRSTQCDFCKKKIWLKDAVQCRDCALCCHKKCIAKCLSTEKCRATSQPSQGENWTSRQYDKMTININSPDNPESDVIDSSFDSQKTDESLLGPAILGLLGGLRRVGSAHSLSPSTPSAPIARSLPPSPHLSPRIKSTNNDTEWPTVENIVENETNIIT